MTNNEAAIKRLQQQLSLCDGYTNDHDEICNVRPVDLRRFIAAYEQSRDTTCAAHKQVIAQYETHIEQQQADIESLMSELEWFREHYPFIGKETLSSDQIEGLEE